MLELALIVCLANDPAKCKDVGLIYSVESVTPYACMMGSMPEIAKWADANPKWYVKRWTCRPAGRVANI
jgi:hypothetical protein